MGQVRANGGIDKFIRATYIDLGDLKRSVHSLFHTASINIVFLHDLQRS